MVTSFLVAPCQSLHDPTSPEVTMPLTGPVTEGHHIGKQLQAAKKWPLSRLQSQPETHMWSFLDFFFNQSEQIDIPGP